ncbi:MAG: hypothetical protein HQK55_03915 [Deltaproteobacteria bacterium]|nr:hypothetical protein [Deltaproteobacteria bacterium]
MSKVEKYVWVLLQIAIIAWFLPARVQAQDNPPTASYGSGQVFLLPADIQEQIRGRLISSGNNRDQAPLFSNDFFELSPDRLLLFLGLTDYLSDFSNTFLSVLVDKSGKWSTGLYLPGAPTAMFKDKDNTLWLVTQWQIEGTYPTLYKSRDGLSWSEVTLPANRNVDCCFEILEDQRAASDMLFLKFKSDTTGLSRCWDVDYQALALVKPPWREVPCADLSRISSHWVRVSAGNWLREEKSDSVNVFFRHSGWPVSVAAPKSLILR